MYLKSEKGNQKNFKIVQFLKNYAKNFTKIIKIWENFKKIMLKSI